MPLICHIYPRGNHITGADQYSVENVTYAVLDQSHSEASTSLLATLDGTRFFQRVADLQNTARSRNPLIRKM